MIQNMLMDFPYFAIESLHAETRRRDDDRVRAGCAYLQPLNLSNFPPRTVFNPEVKQ
jgi:hypothetical protein